MTDLTEMNKLEKYLKEKKIPYDRIDESDRFRTQGIFGTSIYDFHQIVVYNPVYNKKREFDAVCQKGTYGHELGLLEIMGAIVTDEERKSDDVVGWLTAKDVIERIKVWERTITQ